MPGGKIGRCRVGCGALCCRDDLIGVNRWFSAGERKTLSASSNLPGETAMIQSSWNG
jgi:hypothetical protein